VRELRSSSAVFYASHQMSERPDTVDCAEHGSRAATYVCQHLVTGQGLGFYYGFDAAEPDALFPNAWCAACAAIRETEGEWNDRSEGRAGIRLLCSDCYQRVRLLNWSRNTHVTLAQLQEQSVKYLNRTPFGITIG